MNPRFHEDATSRVYAFCSFVDVVETDLTARDAALRAGRWFCVGPDEALAACNTPMRGRHAPAETRQLRYVAPR